MAGKEVACSSSSTISEHAPLDFIKDLEEARDKGMFHFAHEHRLEFKERMKYHGISCKACGVEIEGCGYFSCTKVDRGLLINGHANSRDLGLPTNRRANIRDKMCPWGFYLHQICAFLPRELPNYLNHHSQHTLILYQKDSLSTQDTQDKCSLCSKHIKGNFFYSCNMCSFCLDVMCASKRLFVCGNTHDHPLTPKLYPALIECFLCQQKLQKLGIYYECNTCTFMVHEECYSAPTIKHVSHAHPPRITYANFDLLSQQCALCDESEFKEGVIIYSCAKCKYYIHRHCSLKKWEKKPINTCEVKGELIEFPMPTAQSIEDLLSCFIKQKCEWKVFVAEDKIEPLLKHACHDHPLVLNDSNSLTISDRSCNACSLLVSDDSFYSCTQLSCKFVLHKWCAKLPLEMQHPAHPGHTLLLKSQMYVNLFDLFTCNGCGQVGNGFAYNCSECSFDLDVRCACFLSYVKHETHEHPLHLGVCTKGRSCTSCGGHIISGFSFGCDACTFSIDICCLLLPRKITHWYDREHGFKLKYDLPVCEQGYYCEFCEKKLDKNQWIYHCLECDWSLDTKCVRKALNLFQGSMVLGGIQCSPLHKHPLICVLVPREWHTICNECSKNNYENDGHGFSCTECKIVFCTDCVLKQRLSRRPQMNGLFFKSWKERYDLWKERYVQAEKESDSWHSNERSFELEKRETDAMRRIAKNKMKMKMRRIAKNKIKITNCGRRRL